MVFKLCFLLICFCGFKSSFSQRRIIHGSYSQGKKYLVYLLNSKYSTVQPESWLCGGSLISESRILTSAACLTQVEYIYAIAGYKKYIRAQDIENDECTRTRKKKIVEIVVPKVFKQSGMVQPSIWMKVDAGIAVVEKPYDFKDLSYRIVCSYEPESILINYDINLEQPNTAAVAYGWGGTKARQPGVIENINSEYLREARTVITNITFCANYVTEELKSTINDSLICAFSNEYSDFNQRELNSGERDLNDCKWRRFNLNESDFDLCSEDESILFRNRHTNNKISQNINPKTRKHSADQSDGGICENDHGGPLVTWIGTTEVVIGIALTSVYNAKYECQGPFLFIGTGRSGSLIQCLLAQTNETRALCKFLHDIQIIKINWPKESDELMSPTREQINIKKIAEKITGNLNIESKHDAKIAKPTTFLKELKQEMTNRDARVELRPQLEMRGIFSSKNISFRLAPT